MHDDDDDDDVDDDDDGSSIPALRRVSVAHFALLIVVEMRRYDNTASFTCLTSIFSVHTIDGADAGSICGTITLSFDVLAHGQITRRERRSTNSREEPILPATCTENSNRREDLDVFLRDSTRIHLSITTTL